MLYYVRYRNDTAFNVVMPMITTRFLDGDRNTLTNWNSTGIGVSGVVVPGQIGVGLGVVAAGDRPAVWARWQVWVEGTPTRAAPTQFAYTNSRSYTDASGRAHAVGTITNISSWPTIRGNVNVTTLDINKNVYEVRVIYFKDVLGHDLAPGESYDFDIAMNRTPPAGSTWQYGAGGE